MLTKLRSATKLYLNPTQKHSKQLLRRDGLFQVIERINENAYKLDFSSEYNVSASFNVTNLSPFDVGEDLLANPFQERGNEENQVAKAP